MGDPLNDPTAVELLRAVGEAVEAAGDDTALCGLVILDNERQVPVGGFANIADLLAGFRAEGVASVKLCHYLSWRTRELAVVVIAPSVTLSRPAVVLRRRMVA